MKVNEGARSNVSIYESNSYMVLEYRKLEYNKELKFFKLKFCVTFLIKIIHISSIFFYETWVFVTQVPCQTQLSQTQILKKW